MKETHWVPNHFMPILHHLAYGNLGQIALWALGLAYRDHLSLQSKNFLFLFWFGDPLTSIVEPVPRAEEPKRNEITNTDSGSLAPFYEAQ
jgi:hypothetical protein